MNFHRVSRESAGRILAVVAFSFGLVFLPIVAWPSLAWVREYVYMPGLLVLLLFEYLGVRFSDSLGDLSDKSQMVVFVASLAFWVLIIAVVWKVAKSLRRRGERSTL